MAGRTIEEARAAYRAAQTKQRDSSHTSKAPVANVATTSTPAPTPSSGTVFVNGLPYVLDPQWSPPSPSAHIAEVNSSDDDYQHRTCIALSEPFSALFNSSAFSISNNAMNLPNHASQLDPSIIPFIIDTGATCHISPFRSDFASLTPISAHPVKGLGTASLNAVSMGTIEIRTASSSILSLHNALYVPDASVRLISVFLLGDCNTHFYPKQGFCLICDKENNIILRGDALPDRRLFTIPSSSVLVSSSLSPSSAHYASPLPGIDTWHKRLGHCGPRAVVDMARSNVVEGMRVSLSSPPPKCPHCILGKQTCSSVLNFGRVLGRVDLLIVFSLTFAVPCLFLRALDAYTA